MNLLDSSVLPTAQFAALSFLLQLHHDDFSGADEREGARGPIRARSNGDDEPEFVGVYDVDAKVYYTPPASTVAREATVVKVHRDELPEPRYTILVEGKEIHIDNSRLTPIQNEADKSAGPSVARRLAHSVLREEMTTVSPTTLLDERRTKCALESLYAKIMAERGMRDDFCGIGDRNDSEADAPPMPASAEEKEDETTTASGKVRKGVSFRHDTKAGREQPAALSEASRSESAKGDAAPVRMYRPPSHHVRCSPGLAVYYVQIDIEDARENGENSELLRRVASALLPDLSLAAFESDEKLSGVVLLAVGTIGPPCDLYGSPLMASLPARLREGISTLAALDTAPKEVEVILPDDRSDEEKKKGKSSKLAISHFSKNEEPTEAPPRTRTVVYDSPYFSRLYAALLSTLMDDEDGLLRDHEVVGSPRDDRETVAPPQSIDASSGKVPPSKVDKRKLFTFSRKNKSQSKYESGKDIAGGALPAEAEADKDKSQASSSSAEIARRIALQMEILSLAEDDMSIPTYRAGDASERKRPHQAKSPKSGGGMAAIASGRFGRRENPFDLAGFEYRAAFSGGSVSGTASTVATASDDASANTGDETATLSSKFTMLSSQSSVPTLSKSKKDSASTSSRFKFLQKRKESRAASKAKAAPPASAPAASPKPPLFPQERAPPPQVFDPFADEEFVGEEKLVEIPEDRTEASEADSVASGSTKETPPQPQVMGAVSRSFSEDESEGAPASVPPSPIPATEEDGDMIEPEYEEEDAVVVRRCEVDLALNEDLTCEYKKSKLSSISVDGTVQVRIKSYEDRSPNEETRPPIPFFLIFRDPSAHIKSVQENKKFVENVDVEGAVREYTYSITVPREEEYFPVVRYKCTSSLRPVPIRVQSRVRTQGKSCRVALQISSNPQNPSDLVHLTIIMGVPKGVVKGESLQCNPPGGTYNEAKSVVLWCVSELGGGEKFQLQAMFELEDDYYAENVADLTAKLEFPVLARCQCSGAQLSDVALEISDVADVYPAELTKNIVTRFRVSHKEK